MSKRLSAKVFIKLNEDAVQSFNKIKNAVVPNEVILNYPDPNKEYHLTTDASNRAIGAVLSQNKKPITKQKKIMRLTKKKC